MSIDILEKHISSIFRAEIVAKQKTQDKQAVNKTPVSC
jgi:hypothetical protein